MKKMTLAIFLTMVSNNYIYSSDLQKRYTIFLSIRNEPCLECGGITTGVKMANGGYVITHKDGRFHDAVIGLLNLGEAQEKPKSLARTNSITVSSNDHKKDE